MAFYEEGSQLLTREAFEFVLDAELKRAERMQVYLTLALVEVTRQWEGMEVPVDHGTLVELGQIMAKELRDTDVLGCTDESTLSLLLLDADFEHAIEVIHRLIGRIEHYEFAVPLRVVIGAACHPTQAGSHQELVRQARVRPIAQWRAGPTKTSTRAGQT